MAASPLYSDRMSSLFGMTTRAATDNPVKNIRATAETLKNMEQDGLDSSHDMQDLLEEQIKLLKQMNKNIKQVGDKLDVNNASSIFDNVTDLLGMGGGGGKRRRGGRPGVIRRGFDGLKDVSRRTAQWTKSIVGSFGTAFTATATNVVNGVKSIPSKSLTFITGMATTMLTSIGTMVTDLGNLLGSSMKTVAKFAAKLITPALAAWGAYEGINKSRELDPEGKTGWLGRANAGAAGALNDLAFGLPSMLSEKLFGQSFSEMTINGDIAKQKLIEQARANGQKTLGDYFSDIISFQGPGAARDSVIEQARSNGQKSLGDYFWGMFGNATHALANPAGNTPPVTAPITPSTTVDEGYYKVEPTAPAALVPAAKAAVNAGAGNAINSEFSKFIPFNFMSAIGFLTAANTEISAGLTDIVKASENATKAIDNQTVDNNTGDRILANKGDETIRELKKQTRNDMMDEAGIAQADAAGTGSMGDTIKNAPLPPEQISGSNTNSTSGVNPGQVMGPKQTQVSPELPSAPGVPQSSGLVDNTGRVVSTAATELGVKERALLDTIAIGNPNAKGYWESPNYNTIVGGKQFSDFSDHPRVFGTAESTAAGRYQFTKTTWDDTVAKFNKLNPNDPIKDFSPRNQDRAALYLAEQDYKRRSGGRSLRADMESGVDMGPRIKEYLGGSNKNTTWEIFQKKNAQQVSEAYAANVAKNQGYMSAPQTEKVSGVVQQTQGQVAGIRKQAITDSLQTELAKNVLEVFGEGYRAEVYSGGQPHKGEAGDRTGSTRHDGGKAGDLKIYGPDGKQITQDQYATFAQNWLANGRGSIGLQMSGGGIHVDDHKDRAPFWNYDGQGGIKLSKSAMATIQKGLQGQKPENLAMTPEQAVAKLSGDILQQTVQQQTLKEASQGQPGLARLLQTKNFQNSIKPQKSMFETGNSSLGDVYGATPDVTMPRVITNTDRLLNKQGEAIAKGVVQAERLAPKQLTFDPVQQTNAIMSGVEQAPANSVVAQNPKGSTKNGAEIPNINSIPHTDELVMLLANSPMMA